MPPISELIKSCLLLLKENPVIFASEQDAAYFAHFAERKHLQEKEKIGTAHTPISQDPDCSPRERTPLAPPLQKKPEICAAQNAPAVRMEPAIRDVGVVIQNVPSPPPKDAPILLGEHKTSALRKLCAHLFPELALIDAIPNDAIARKIANRWKVKNQSAPISLLFSNELAEHKMFLEDIALALDVHFDCARMIPADPIEKEDQWESFLSAKDLKLVILCDSTLWQLHQLRKFYKENPAQSTRLLGKVPLFLLPNLSLYFKDISLKKALWHALVQQCTMHLKN